MKIIILMLLITSSFTAFNNINAKEVMVKDQETNQANKEKDDAIQLAYETYTPIEHDKYKYQGVNLSLRRYYPLQDSELVMTMGPNISVLSDEYKNEKEDLLLLKWNHGIAYNFEAGNNLLIRPNAQLGLGYGWMDAKRKENAPLAELLIGLNFIPNENVDLYVKAGYRFFNLDDAGSDSLGDLKGQIAMAGLGVSY